MIDPALVARAQALLNRARMIAEAPAQQYSPLGPQHAGGSIPTSGISTLKQVGDRIVGAVDDEEMRAAIRWGTHECDGLQGFVARGQVPETRREFHQRIVADYEGVIAPTVAAQERCSVTEVRAARTGLGRTARFGSRIAGKGLAGQ